MNMLDWLNDLIRAPASCVVRIGGIEVNDLYPNLVEVSAVLNHAEASEATLVFETRRLEDGVWNIHDDNRVRPWQRIQIAATFGDREDEIFQGFIRQVQVSFPEQKGAATVTVTCQDTSLLLDRSQRNFRWGSDTPKTDSDIAQTILTEAGLSFLDTPGTGMSDLVVQQNETDIRFLVKRAQENAFDLFFREGQLYFGEPRLERSPQPTILVYAGTSTSCIRFDLNDDGHHPDSVIYEIATDSGDTTTPTTLVPNLPLLGTEPVSSASSSEGEFAWRISREGVSSDAQAQQRAQAQANTESLKIKATGELDGVMYGHVLLPGDPVGIDGVGNRYGGRWYVTKVEHKFDMSGYKQSFEVARNAYGDDLLVSSNPLAAVF
jgi:phage protein D